MVTKTEIPSDEAVLKVVRSSGRGIAPSELLNKLELLGHTRANTIRAIQRVFDRGLVSLGDGGRLIEPPKNQRAAA